MAQKFPLIIDVETKYSFRQFADPQKLGVSVAIIYDFADREFHAYTESQLQEMFKRMESASYVIGFNNIGFDLPVLQGYYHGDITNLSSFDMLADIKATCGRRFSLNDIAAATLGVKKSGNGLQALEWYKAGEIQKIIDYCRDDVKITKQVLEFGANYGFVYVGQGEQKMKIATRWEKYLTSRSNENVVPSTLPF